LPCERQSAEIRSTGRPQHRFHFFPLWQGHGPLREGGAGIGRGIAAEGLGAGRERLALAHRLRAFLRAAAVFLALLAWPPLRPICRMASRSSSGFIAGENAKRLACVNDGVGERSAQQVQTGFRTTQFVLIWVIDEPRGFASLNPERPRWRGAASLRDARGLADRGRTLQRHRQGWTEGLRSRAAPSISHDIHSGMFYICTYREALSLAVNNFRRTAIEILRPRQIAELFTEFPRDRPDGACENTRHRRPLRGSWRLQSFVSQI